MAKIQIYLQRGVFPSPTDLAAERELSQLLVDDAFRPLDFPKKESHPIIGLVCTPSDVVERTKKVREDVANTIAYEIKMALLAAMAANDTENGYPIKKG